MVSSRNSVGPMKMRRRSSEVIGGSPEADSQNNATNVRGLGRADKGFCGGEAARRRRAATPFERGAQGSVDFRHRDQLADVLQARHPAVGDSAWHDALEMAKVGRYVERDPVRRHPLAD